MKKTTKHQTQGMCLGMCFGMSIGMTLGNALFDNMATGMCMGISLGMALGMAIGAAKDKQINDQLEKLGYTIKTITMNEDGSATATIADREGNEQTVDVPKNTMEEEQLAVGDSVYLDEEGALEKAYGEEDGEEKEE